MPRLKWLKSWKHTLSELANVVVSACLMHSTVIKEQKLRSVNIIQYCFYHEFELEQIAAVSTFFDCAAFMSVHAKESVHEAQFLFQNYEVFAVRFWIKDTEKTKFISIIMTIFNCSEIDKPIMIRNNGDRGGRGSGKLQPYHFHCWDFFVRAPYGTQMEDKLRNTDLNICLCWPDFFCPTTLKWSPWSLKWRLFSQ